MTKLRLLIFLFCLFSFNTLFAAPYRPGAVIYGVVPPLFGNPPFQAVTKHLDRLDKLGVDVLWISPVFATDDESQISYAVTDFFKLREDFGSERDFRQLIAAAHARGMRVILDIVPNHTSDQHPFFQDAERFGRASRYYDFYQRDAQGRPQYYFDWKHLPNLNYDNVEVQKHIASAFAHWMKNFGVDGFRVDVAWGVRERAPWFWPKLRNYLEQSGRPTILLAEASARDVYYTKNGFDLAYDWTKELGKWAWEPAFASPGRVGELLARAISESMLTDPRMIARFLNNNDTGERFITRYDPQMQKLAAVVQFTVPGVPILYSGDEVGAEYSPYEDPEPIVWRDSHDLSRLYSWLSELRELSPALHSGLLIGIPMRNPQTIAFARFDEVTQSWAMPLVNFGSSDLVFEFEWPYQLAAAYKNVLCDALELREVTVEKLSERRVRVALPARSALLLTRASACEALRLR